MGSGAGDAGTDERSTGSGGVASAEADLGETAATFGLLSDETRVRIVRELADTADGLRFSELQSRAGVRDPGRFNYHLEKLCGRLVEKSGETYVLTPAGADVADLL